MLCVFFVFVLVNQLNYQQLDVLSGFCLPNTINHIIATISTSACS